MNPLLIGLLAVSQLIKLVSPATQKITSENAKKEKRQREQKERIKNYVLCCGQKKTRNRIRNYFSYSKKVSRACIINCIKITQITYYGISFNIQRHVKEIGKMYHV